MLTPYYDQDGITIYHSDAFAVLPLVDRIDAVLTDPPYSSGTRSEASRPSSGAMVRAGRFSEAPIDLDQMTTTGFVWLMRNIAMGVYPKLRDDGGNFLTFIDWRQWPTMVGALETVNLRVNDMVVWDKLSIGLGNGFRNRHELVVHASKGVPRVCDRSVPNVLAVRREANDDHPAPKPAELMRQLLRVITEPGDLVFDPFMGSGPVAEACRDMGRRYIGVELVEEYCAAAVRRLSQIPLPLEVAT